MDEGDSYDDFDYNCFAPYTDEELRQQIDEALEWRDWYTIDLIWDELDRRERDDRIHNGEPA